MYVLIDGTNTQEYKLRVTALPPIQIPQKRVKLITIPGRSGNMTQWDGSYEDIVKPVGFFYRDPYPERIAQLLLSGSTITFSNEPAKVYDYRIDVSTDLIKTIAEWHQFDVQFICNPLKREASPAIVSANTSPVFLTNQCNHPAYPSIILTGSGDVTLAVGDQDITLKDIGPEIVIDGDALECYQGTTLASDKMIGDFPVIGIGETVSISWEGIVTAIKILPNWRWV